MARSLAAHHKPDRTVPISDPPQSLKTLVSSQEDGVSNRLGVRSKVNEGGIRVLIAADVSPLQKSGGSARVIREHTRGLGRRGYAVRVVCRHPGGDLPMKDHIEGTPVLHYRVSRGCSLAYAVTSFFAARKTLERLLSRESWDVMILHQPFSAAAVQSVLAHIPPRLYCFYSPAGVEYELRASTPGSTKVPRGTRIASLALARLERIAINRAHRVVVLSEFSRRALEESHGTIRPPISKIPGGADPTHFRPAGNRTAVRERLGLPCEAPVLLTVRDLEQRMGIETLLEAVRKLSRSGRVFCIVGGTGPLGGFLEERASQLGIRHVVRFVGHIPEEELPPYYQAADLFVLPTQSHEGFGLVTVEALACGTPVVATPAGATPEILAPLDRRLLAAGTDADSLASAITQALEFAVSEAFRRRCRHYAESRYSWTEHLNALEHEILAVCEAPR